MTCSSSCWIASARSSTGVVEEYFSAKSEDHSFSLLWMESKLAFFHNKICRLTGFLHIARVVMSMKITSWSLRAGRPQLRFTKEGLLVMTMSRMLSPRVGKSITCSRPAVSRRWRKDWKPPGHNCLLLPPKLMKKWQAYILLTSLNYDSLCDHFFFINYVI